MTNEKKTLWETVKDAVKIGLPVSLLVSPIVTNVGSYFTTKGDIASVGTPQAKEIIAEIYKKSYENGNFINKACFIGEYLAANQYLAEWHIKNKEK